MCSISDISPHDINRNSLIFSHAESQGNRIPIKASSCWSDFLFNNSKDILLLNCSQLYGVIRFVHLIKCLQG